MKQKRDYEMSTVKKNDFEMTEGWEIVTVRNRIQAKKGKKIKFQTQIIKGRRKAKWSKTEEKYSMRSDIQKIQWTNRNCWRTAITVNIHAKQTTIYKSGKKIRKL